MVKSVIGEEVILVADETTVSKSGKSTYRLGYFYSGLQNRAIKKIIDYYSLRFQIEFNFRDAKQFFGLEDFMNIKKRCLHNFANLSLFMNNLTYLIYKDIYFSRYSINDIKSLFMAERYAKEALKFYGQNGDDILISDDILDIALSSLQKNKKDAKNYGGGV